MPAIITNKFRIHNSEQFTESFSESAPNVYYLGIGRPIPYATSTRGDSRTENLGTEFLFPEIKYKFHACCHGLHAFLEALDELKTKNNFNPDSIEKISIQTQPSWLQVCNIDSPKTGLEAKFSYRLTAAMSLHGVDTGRLDSYNDEICFEKANLARFILN